MANDYVEVKFLEADNGDISVTKFLYDVDEQDYGVDEFADFQHHGYEAENDIMDNDTLENGKKKKKAAPKNGKKKKKSKDTSTDYDPHEVIVHFQNDLASQSQYYLQ